MAVQIKARDEKDRGVGRTHAAVPDEECNAELRRLSRPRPVQSAMASGKMYFNGSTGSPSSWTS